MEELQINFIGAKDDGLAARHSGQNGLLAGNALEALELFAMALQMNRSYLPDSISLMTRITDTGDSDMVKVPSGTGIRVILDGNGVRDIKRTTDKIKSMAAGTALMAGCTASIETINCF